MSVGVLSYAGNAGLDDMDAFNTRVQFTWKGDHLFRVYPRDGQLYFIRVGGSKRKNAAVGAQFGLIGMLIVYFSSKREAAKTKQTLNQIAGADPVELLASHKLNFTLPVEQIRSSELLAPPMLGGTSGRWRVVEQSGKKRNMSFDDVENMRLAVDKLPGLLSDKLKVGAVWNEQKKKFKKIK